MPRGRGYRAPASSDLFLEPSARTAGSANAALLAADIFARVSAERL